MASTSFAASSLIFRPTQRPSTCVPNSFHRKVCWLHDVSQNSITDKFHEVKAASGNRNTKPNSVICDDCDGNGAVQCSQCKGGGVNTSDLFNGQFKAGDSCWLCGGKKHMLCGNCNGAGFVGGFMSTYDE